MDMKKRLAKIQLISFYCKTKKRDAGIYTCFANNSVGQKEKQLKLLVNCKYDSVTINDEATVNSITYTTTLSKANKPAGHYCLFSRKS